MTLLGLTGSIGMGKSTVAGMFRDLGIPVFDADAAVHRLQGPGGALVAEIERHFPGTTRATGVDRTALSEIVLADAPALGRLEALVHPAVAKERERFIAQHKDAPLIVLDIPLLFEKASDVRVDKVAVVSAPADIQRRRVLARLGMTAQRFETILRLQLPDAEKRQRADFVIPTGGTLAETYASVRSIIACLTGSRDS